MEVRERVYSPGIQQRRHSHDYHNVTLITDGQIDESSARGEYRGGPSSVVLKAAAFALINARTLMLPEKCYEVVPVGADWTGNENVLGYPNGLDKHDYVTKPALDLILHAQLNEDTPHFLILDEMNLSHVERYFADVLSAIVSRVGVDAGSQILSQPHTAGSDWLKARLASLAANISTEGVATT